MIALDFCGNTYFFIKYLLIFTFVVVFVVGISDFII